MLPNFTVVICGAVLTVLMLAMAGSGLIDPETRTPIGAMPEIGRPMMQRMIAEPVAQAQFAALERSRRAEELLRLRDLAPAIVDPAPAADHDVSQQPATESAAQTSETPPDKSPAAVAEVPTATMEAVPAEAGEATPAAVAPAVPDTAAAESVAIAEPTPPAAAGPVAIAEPTPSAAAEQAGAAPAPTIQATTLAVEPADATPAAVSTEPAVEPSLAVPPPAMLESVATVRPSEAPSVTERSEPSAEPPASAPQRLALAEPDAVPAPEVTAKLAARTGEPEETAPIHRWVARVLPRLPRIIPAPSRRSLQRFVRAQLRVAPSFTRHVYAKSRLDAAKTDVAKAALAPRKPVHHWVRHVQHRAQRASVAPDKVVSPYPAYSVTSGVQYW
jgi:hypothetical protein